MKMNKEKFVIKLQEKTLKSYKECLLVCEILESHHIVGKNNKKKIIIDFMDKLHIGYKDADELYNICMENILKGFLRS